MNNWFYPLADEPNLKEYLGHISVQIYQVYLENQISFIFLLSIFNQIWRKASWTQRNKSLRKAAELSQNRKEHRPDHLGRGLISLSIIRLGLSLAPLAYVT